MANRWGNNGKSETIFLGSKIAADDDCSHEIKRILLLGRESVTNLDIKKQRHYFANKGLSSQSFGLSSQNLMAESKEELKSLLRKVKEESEKVGLEVSIQKMKIMTSGLITSCQIDGETMETVRNFIFGGSKITANGDCSHEMKRCLLLRRKAMTNLDIKKQRHYFANKGLSSQNFGFSISHL